MPVRKLTRRKALLAILIAGGMLHSQVPAFSDNKIESTDSIIQEIANNSQNTPDVRAYHLLRLAQSYLAGYDRTVVEASFRSLSNQPIQMIIGEPLLIPWADQLAVSSLHRAKEATPDSHPRSYENSVLADTAIQTAITELDKSSNAFAKLNMYFIASRLFQKAGDTNGMQRCTQALEKAFKSIEKTSPVDEKGIEAAASVLDSMAYGLTPINIPNRREGRWNRDLEVDEKTFATKDTKESERLKLRAAALLDRLPPTNQARRKAHRDLVFWYKQLDKPELAEKQKEIVFELVGSNNDNILYPKSGGCGRLVWWETKTDSQTGQLACGMG